MMCCMFVLLPLFVGAVWWAVSKAHGKKGG